MSRPDTALTPPSTNHTLLSAHTHLLPQTGYMAGPEAKTKVLNTYFKGQTTGSGGGVRAAPARELVRAGSGGHRRRSVHQTCRGLGATGKDDKTAAATTGQRQARNRHNRSVGSPEPFFKREHGATVMPDGLLATQINKIDATLRNGFPSSLDYQNQLFGTGKVDWCGASVLSGSRGSAVIFSSRPLWRNPALSGNLPL